MADVTIQFDGPVARVYLDGKDVSQKVTSFTVAYEARADVPQLILEYACYEQGTIDGEMEVVHVCPKKARE